MPVKIVTKLILISEAQLLLLDLGISKLLNTLAAITITTVDGLDAYNITQLQQVLFKSKKIHNILKYQKVYNLTFVDNFHSILASTALLILLSL